MELKEIEKNLISIYGDNVFEEIFNEVKYLKKYSNISFDPKYIRLSLSFCAIKAEQIINGEKGKCNLRSLVSESFGEAAMYKYNICGGVLNEYKGEN